MASLAGASIHAGMRDPDHLVKVCPDITTIRLKVWYPGSFYSSFIEGLRFRRVRLSVYRAGFVEIGVVEPTTSLVRRLRDSCYKVSS